MNIPWVKQLFNSTIPIIIYSKYHTTGEPMGFHTSLPALLGLLAGLNGLGIEQDFLRVPLDIN